MQALLRAADRLRPAALYGLALALVAVVGLIDYLTGPEISFSIFYLAPIALVAGTRHVRGGLVLSALSAGTWLLADLESGQIYSHPAIPYWNMLVRLGFFLIVTFTLVALRRALDSERQLARTDPLTGLANSRRFLEIAEAEHARARRYARPYALIYIDVDDFKRVNDTLGHAGGDALLARSAALLRSRLRATDQAARLGGDEFAVLMPETSLAGARHAVAGMLEQLRVLARDEKWPVTFSAGVVACDEPPDSVETVIRAADNLMYEAKAAGKDRVFFRQLEAGAV